MPKDQRWDEIVATSCRNWNYLLKRGDSACFGVKNNFELSQKNSQLLTDRQWSRNGFCWHDVLGVHHKHSRPQVPPLHLQVAAECLSFQLEIHDSFIHVTVFLTSPPKKKTKAWMLWPSCGFSSFWQSSIHSFSQRNIYQDHVFAESRNPLMYRIQVPPGLVFGSEFWETTNWSKMKMGNLPMKMGISLQV